MLINSQPDSTELQKLVKVDMFENQSFIELRKNYMKSLFEDKTNNISEIKRVIIN